MTIRGLSTFKMETLRLSMVSLIPLRQRMDFDVVIPAVNVDTSKYNHRYDLSSPSVYWKEADDIGPPIHHKDIVDQTLSWGNNINYVVN